MFLHFRRGDGFFSRLPARKDSPRSLRMQARAGLHPLFLTEKRRLRRPALLCAARRSLRDPAADADQFIGRAKDAESVCRNRMVPLERRGRYHELPAQLLDGGSGDRAFRPLP